jgi:hypothetical protein
MGLQEWLVGLEGFSVTELWGSLFQRFGAVKAKARPPIVECLTRGTFRRTADSDLRLWRPFLLGWIIDLRYSGASPSRHLNTNRRILYWTRYGAGSQWRWIRTGEIWSNFVVPILISEIHPDQPAERCQGLYIGDAILSVNGLDLRSAKHAEAVSILSQQVGILVSTFVPLHLVKKYSGSCLSGHLCLEDMSLNDTKLCHLMTSVVMLSGLPNEDCLLITRVSFEWFCCKWFWPKGVLNLTYISTTRTTTHVWILSSIPEII